MTYDIQRLIRDYEVARNSAGYSSHTIERVVLTMRMICRDMNINNLSELTTEVLLGWGDKKRKGVFGKELSQSGLYAAFNSARSFVKYLDNCDIPHGVNKKQIHCKPAYKQRKALRPEDIKIITRYAEWYEISLLIRLLFNGGMRISEALGLTLDDLKADNSIDVVSKWCKARTIFIGPVMRQELEWNAKDGGYLFRDRKDPTKPLNRKSAYYYVKRAMRKAGYGEYFPHAERHGFATDILRNGGDISSLRGLMGHTHITTTQIYEHLMTDDFQKTHAQFHTFV